jgi:hypothetical protein
MATARCRWARWIAAWDGWRGNMYRLVVIREHRRRGIDRALVRAGEEYLRRQGAYRITALVAQEDEAASAFWESAGYCPAIVCVGNNDPRTTVEDTHARREPVHACFSVSVLAGGVGSTRQRNAA